MTETSFMGVYTDLKYITRLYLLLNWLQKYLNQ